MRNIIVHTDGSSNKDKTLCGWAFVISDENKEVVHIEKGSQGGTHNVGELLGILNAMKYCYNVHGRTIKSLHIYSDSQYCVDPIYYGTLDTWKMNGWTRSDGEPTKNCELWKEIDFMLTQFKRKGITLDVQWVRGHNKNVLNEIADKHAVEARTNFIQNDKFKKF